MYDNQESRAFGYMAILQGADDTEEMYGEPGANHPFLAVLVPNIVLRFSVTNSAYSISNR